MADEIFLAKWYDRHVDDEYAAFWTLEDAIRQCQEWASTYGERYTFHVPGWEWDKHWEYYVESGDDCPVISVQKVELK